MVGEKGEVESEGGVSGVDLGGEKWGGKAGEKSGGERRGKMEGKRREGGRRRRRAEDDLEMDEEASRKA